MPVFMNLVVTFTIQKYDNRDKKNIQFLNQYIIGFIQNLKKKIVK